MELPRLEGGFLLAGGLFVVSVLFLAKMALHKNNKLLATIALWILFLVLVSISVPLGCFSPNKSNFRIAAGNLDLTSRVSVLSHVCSNVIQMLELLYVTQDFIELALPG